MIINPSGTTAVRSSLRLAAHQSFHTECDVQRRTAFAVGLEAAGRIIADGMLAAFVKNRYASYDKGKGAAFAKGKMGFADLAALAKDYDTVGIQSGKQERLENLVNQYLMGL